MTSYIKCPNCNAEYHPAEIFFPRDFFGEPGQIIRDQNNQIVTITGTDMNLNETYRCDFCNTTFKTISKISFNTTEQINYDKPYSSTIRKNCLFLQED